MIFDLEADGLLEEATKIHVFSYYKDGEYVSLYDYDDIREVVSKAKLLIGHNIVCYDIPVIEKILGIKVKAKLIDTLGLSWYLYPSRARHGLEFWGEEFGVPKPKISDWHNLSRAKYADRCEKDVKINRKLWIKQKSYLLKLYEDKKSADRLISYLTFKLDCLREQERSKWQLNKRKATTHMYELLFEERDKIEALKSVMPEVRKDEYADRKRPAKPYKKDGTLSVTGARWFSLLRKNNLPEDYNGSVKVFIRTKVDPPNPGSHIQVKEWLFSLGWEPANFKYEKEDDGSERAIPQVRVDSDEGKVLCPSVKLLMSKEPGISHLEGLTVVQHRLATFKGFLDNEDKGFLVAGAAGFTNTLRLKHRVLVNLPGVDKPWGKEIRGSLQAPEGYVLCGSDMCSLEDNTKKHYMFSWDPEYVKEMSREGFDPHLDLAIAAKAVTQLEVNNYLKGVVEYSYIKAVRGEYKVANYSCVYGVGARKLSLTLGCSIKKAGELIEAYWKRNWAVSAVADSLKVIEVNGQKWLYNPVSRFYYSLRYEKDRFSTLNQGTGVYCFDTWIRNFRRKRSQLTGQFHDEIILCIKEGFEDKCKILLKQAIKETNEQLKLNVTLDVDIQFGKTYAEIH